MNVNTSVDDKFAAIKSIIENSPQIGIDNYVLARYCNKTDMFLSILDNETSNEIRKEFAEQNINLDNNSIVYMNLFYNDKTTRQWLCQTYLFDIIHNYLDVKKIMSEDNKITYCVTLDNLLDVFEFKKISKKDFE